MSAQDRLISAATDPWRVDRDGWKARAEAAEARVSELEGLLEVMVDWHERGDMDSSAVLQDRFVNDMNRARALLAPTQSGSTQP
jgi:hypothetical protein